MLNEVRAILDILKTTTMTTNNHTLETERRAQDARCFTYFLINAAIAFALVLNADIHRWAAWIHGRYGYRLWSTMPSFLVWPKMQAEMADRLALIPWMQQIENIYV